MATIEEMSLSRQVLQLGMTITSQGFYQINVEYHGHVDMIDVFAHDKNGGYLEGWSSCDHTVYLGDFHQNTPFGRKNRKGAIQLETLMKEMDSLLKKDADGIPL